MRGIEAATITKAVGHGYSLSPPPRRPLSAQLRRERLLPEHDRLALPRVAAVDEPRVDSVEHAFEART